MDSTIARAWANAVDEDGERNVLVFEDEPMTYAALDREANAVAAGLVARGRKKGDRIGLIGLNRPEWLVVYLAAAKLGLVVVALSVRYRENELLHMLAQSEACMLVAPRAVGDFAYEDYLAALRPRLPALQEIVLLDGDTTPLRAPIVPDALAAADVSPDDPILLLYTSGTTGRPKGAMLTHRSQLASARMQARHTRMTKEDVMPLAMPMNHVGGISCGFLTTVVAHSSVILIPVFQAKTYVAALARHRATLVIGVPTLLTLTVREPSVKELDTSRIRLVIGGGANVEPALFEALHATFPHAEAIMNLYGLSETSGTVVMSPWGADFAVVSRSIGRALDDAELTIRDDEGKPVPTGETGEIWVRSPAVVPGYWAMPEETANAITDGWLHTGDVGFVDDDRNVVLRGRKKEMFLQGGFNVYPVEVENVLARHPAVLMAAGIGIPDPVMGEIGCYFIVVQPGQSVTDEELIAFCRDKVADYKVPRRIVQRSELPLTPAGKIMKSALRHT